MARCLIRDPQRVTRRLCWDYMVRLYLSSFRLGDHRHRLVELAGGGRRVALVGNALDAETDDVRQAGLAREVNELTSLGFTVTEADLRN